MMARHLLVLLVCFAAAVLEAAVPMLLPHGLRGLRADLMLVVVLYLALHDDWIEGAALSFVAGYLADLSAATPGGLYSLLGVITFVAVRSAGGGLKSDGGLSAAAIAFGASLLHALFASLLFRLLIPGSSSSLQPGLLWSAVATGLGAVPTFAVLRAIDARFVPAADPFGGPRTRRR
jgi:rod shape-determining protein MreD